MWSSQSDHEAEEPYCGRVTYTIHGQPLKTVASAKYLGLTVDLKMNYNEHISNISKKANSSRSTGTPEALHGK